MPSSASWTLLPESLTPTDNSFGVTAPPAATLPATRGNSSSFRSFLGCGLVRPFRRDQKNDFANSCGEDLVGSAVGQVLGTRASTEVSQGELPWRTDFGAKLHLLMYDAIDEIFEELARVYAQDALAVWEPRIVVSDVVVLTGEAAGLEEGSVQIRVFWRLIKENVDGNAVVLQGETALNLSATNALVVSYQVGSNPV